MVHRYGAFPGSLEAGHVAALQQLWQLAYREASTLAFADAFRAAMVAFVIATLMVSLMRTVTPPAPSPAVHRCAASTLSCPPSWHCNSLQRLATARIR
jgi:DHA2 family multidrug resistance protein